MPGAERCLPRSPCSAITSTPWAGAARPRHCPRARQVHERGEAELLVNESRAIPLRGSAAGECSGGLDDLRHGKPQPALFDPVLERRGASDLALPRAGPGRPPGLADRSPALAHAGGAHARRADPDPAGSRPHTQRERPLCAGLYATSLGPFYVSRGVGGTDAPALPLPGGGSAPRAPSRVGRVQARLCVARSGTRLPLRPGRRPARSAAPRAVRDTNDGGIRLTYSHIGIQLHPCPGPPRPRTASTPSPNPDGETSWTISRRANVPSATSS